MPQCLMCHRALFVLAVAAAATLPRLEVMAQSYPGKPIRIIVPYTPGGSTDLNARVVGAKLNEALGQPVIVDNRAGAAATIGTEAVVRAAPDGYTLLLGAVQPVVLNPIAFRNLRYDPDRDLAPIIINLLVPNYILVHPSLPARNLKELIAFVKSNPGKVSFASSGIGTTGHLSGLLLAQMAGLTLEHVGYKGSAPATTEVVAGQVPILIDQPVPSIQFIRSGRLRAIAAGSATRIAVLPDLPTAAEQGLAGYESSTWFGFFAPAATPRAVIERLHTGIARIMQMPDVRDKFEPQGYAPVALNPAESAARIRSDREKWGRLMRAAGMEPQPL
jgi:tripartite-type tricarboxylate transporter receptor subunit TctC